MKRLALVSMVVLAAFPLVATPEKATGKARKVKLNGHEFTLPEGFEIEKVAGPPLVNRPIVADFDDQGRLYVADSSGSNDPVQVQLKNRPHRILRLEDTKGTGKFDKATVFADKMMFPEGVMWHAGSLYVSAPPSIWKLTDTKGTGVADQRVEWFKGKTLTGCANDLHGPYLGPDGWIYWCKGAFAHQEYNLPNKKNLVTKAAHIFRCRPDGTGIEPVMTGGMDNPVDVVFTPGGERIFTTTFLQNPAGGLRDGLIHAVYGGIYGKDQRVIYDHPWTSPQVMPVLAHLGAAAPCGLTRYESRVFGKDFQDNLFACCFNMQKLTRHVLTPKGATFESKTVDFLVSGNRDFHPTDVLEDADGSLLVIDTGGWYKLCCPTSQLHKPDVLGGIYRIRRIGSPRISDPRGLKIPWHQLTIRRLARLLGDPRPAVQRRAIESMAKRGRLAIPVLHRWLTNSAATKNHRRNAIWTATRIDHQAARKLVRRALLDKDDSVRQVACHSAGLWRDERACRALCELLDKPSWQNRRAAAEALGRIASKESVLEPTKVVAVAALLKALGNTKDQVLDHSLIYALIEVGEQRKLLETLTSKNPRLRRGALIALDQMGAAKHLAKEVVRDLISTDPGLKEVAWWIAGRHPEWAEELAGYLGSRLKAGRWSVREREDLVRLLARFAGSKPVQELLASHLRIGKESKESCLLALAAMAQSGLKQMPSNWTDGLVSILAQGDADLVGAGVRVARTLPRAAAETKKLNAELTRIGHANSTAPLIRLEALAALSTGLSQVTGKQFEFLRLQLDRDKPVNLRALAADVLSRANLAPDQLVALTHAMPRMGPMDLDRVLDAFAKVADEKIGLSLVSALKRSPALSSLRVETLKPKLAKFNSKVQQKAQAIYALLEVDKSKQKEKLDQLLASMKNGDIRRGQAIFNSPKAACAACHAIGYLGGKIGPDLTHIGKIRSESDLLESIVFPSASLVRSYEPIQITTSKGKVYNGLIRQESATEIFLVTGADQEVRIRRKDIDETKPSKVSIMPAGLDQQLTKQELADLVAFLKACK